MVVCRPGWCALMGRVIRICSLTSGRTRTRPLLDALTTLSMPILAPLLSTNQNVPRAAQYRGNQFESIVRNAYLDRRALILTSMRNLTTVDQQLWSIWAPVDHIGRRVIRPWAPTNLITQSLNIHSASYHAALVHLVPCSMCEEYQYGRHLDAGSMSPLTSPSHPDGTLSLLRVAEGCRGPLRVTAYPSRTTFLHKLHAMFSLPVAIQRCLAPTSRLYNQKMMASAEERPTQYSPDTYPSRGPESSSIS